MSQQYQTEVLVAGAGPAGMVTALLLAEHEIQTTIIDQESGPASHSYACVLHSHSLAILHQLGLASEVLRLGRRIDTVALYEGNLRKAEWRLHDLPGEFPFLVVLPQNTLEELLWNRIGHHRSIEVLRNHRLANLEREGEGVAADVDRLCISSKGYIVSSLDWEVDKTLPFQCRFVVGADGCQSHTRQLLGIDYESLGEPESFAVYEIQSDANYEAEARMILDKTQTSVLWPLPGNRCRWTFQFAKENAPDIPHEKDREDIQIVDPARDQELLERLAGLIQSRAPWFHGSIEEIEWSMLLQFQPKLAQRFGQEACWLVGDAAHQTSPIGMQSMNIGLLEASELADALAAILRRKSPHHILEEYNQSRREEWLRLLGSRNPFKTKGSGWAKAHARQLTKCVPAGGHDLVTLMSQAGLHLEEPMPAVR